MEDRIVKYPLIITQKVQLPMNLDSLLGVIDRDSLTSDSLNFIPASRNLYPEQENTVGQNNGDFCGFE